jgi:hypothetical protein
MALTWLFPYPLIPLNRPIRTLLNKPVRLLCYPHQVVTKENAVFKKLLIESLGSEAELASMLPPPFGTHGVNKTEAAWAANPAAAPAPTRVEPPVRVGCRWAGGGFGVGSGKGRRSGGRRDGRLHRRRQCPGWVRGRDDGLMEDSIAVAGARARQ